MLASEIITEIRQICQETDENNTHASDSVILGWLNSCTIQLCSTIASLPKESVSGITADDTITLTTDLLRMDFASVSDGNTPAKHQPLQIIDLVNFVRMNPAYQDSDTGRPEYIVRMTNLDWMLWPNPSADWSGNAMTIVGSVLPDPMTSFSDSPPVSIVLHPAYIHYGAWKFFLLLNNPERAAASFSAYDALRKMNTQTATSTRGSLLSLRMPQDF